MFQYAIKRRVTSKNLGEYKMVYNNFDSLLMCLASDTNSAFHVQQLTIQLHSKISE